MTGGSRGVALGMLLRAQPQALSAVHRVASPIRMEAAWFSAHSNTGHTTEPYVTVTPDNFQSLLTSSEVPVVLDCFADWCGPCRMLGPVIEQAVAATKGAVVLAKLDTDEYPQLAQKLRVTSLPTVFTVYQGRVVSQFVGFGGDAQVKKFVEDAVAAGKAAPKAK